MNNASSQPSKLNPVAIQFVRHVFRENPGAHDFIDIYDAMSRAAVSRSFRGLGLAELAQVGVSFSLTATGRLEALIEAGRAGAEG